MKIANYIEDKLEEFRISGKHPESISLTSEVMKNLCEELRAKERPVILKIDDVSIKPMPIITKFMNLPVYTEVGPQMPADGVKINEVSKT